MAIAIGQSSKGSSSGATATTAAVNTAASGSTFCVVIITTRTNTIATPTDTNGNTYSLVRQTTTSGGSKVALYECVNGVGGSGHQVTETLSSGTIVTVLFTEITGAKTSSPRDGENAQQDDSQDYTSPGIATSNANDLLIGYFAGNTGTNPATHTVSSATPSSGWTIVANETDAASGFWTGCIAYVVVSATGTYNSGFTEAGAPPNCAAGIAAYQEAPSFGRFDYTNHPKLPIRYRARGLI